VIGSVSDISVRLKRAASKGIAAEVEGRRKRDEISPSMLPMSRRVLAVCN